MLSGIVLFNSGCENHKSKTESNESISVDKPLHPDVKTDFGEIGSYKTMDEYYMNNNGSKVWHGYRKNLYATGQPRLVSFYEHGKLMWTEKYDEVGNVTSTDRK